MPKPIPSSIEYQIGNGAVSLNSHLTVRSGDNSVRLDFGTEPQETAAVLIALAQHILSQFTPDVAHSVLKEAGLKEVSLGTSSLGQAPNVNVTYERMNEMNERKEQSAPSDVTQELVESLLAGGLTADELRYLLHRSGTRTAIVNSTNPVASARTIMARDKHQQAFPAWLKKNPAPKAQAAPASADQGGDSGAAEEDVEVPKSKAFEIED